MPLRREQRRERESLGANIFFDPEIKKKKKPKSRWELNVASVTTLASSTLSTLSLSLSVFISTGRTNKQTQGEEKGNDKKREDSIKLSVSFLPCRPSYKSPSSSDDDDDKRKRNRFCNYWHRREMFRLFFSLPFFSSAGRLSTTTIAIVFSRFLFPLPFLHFFQNSHNTLSLPSPPIQFTFCVCIRGEREREQSHFLSSLGERSARAPYMSPSSNRYSVCASSENHCR